MTRQLLLVERACRQAPCQHPAGRCKSKRNARKIVPRLPSATATILPCPSLSRRNARAKSTVRIGYRATKKPASAGDPSQTPRLRKIQNAETPSVLAQNSFPRCFLGKMAVLRILEIITIVVEASNSRYIARSNTDNPRRTILMTGYVEPQKAAAIATSAEPRA